MYVINGAKSDATSRVKRERADDEGFGETCGFLMLELRGPPCQHQEAHVAMRKTRM